MLYPSCQLLESVLCLLSTRGREWPVHGFFHKRTFFLLLPSSTITQRKHCDDKTANQIPAPLFTWPKICPLFLDSKQLQTTVQIPCKWKRNWAWPKFYSIYVFAFCLSSSDKISFSQQFLRLLIGPIFSLPTAALRFLHAWRDSQLFCLLFLQKMW